MNKTQKTLKLRVIPVEINRIPLFLRRVAFLLLMMDYFDNVRMDTSIIEIFFFVLYRFSGNITAASLETSQNFYSFSFYIFLLDG